MQKIFTAFIFFLNLLVISSTNAASIDYELIRTPENPGYFALRVFPGEDLKPRKVKNIFIKNFKNSAEEKVFENLVKKISEKVTVLEKKDIGTYLKDQNTRIIVLGGEPYPRFFQFLPQNTKNIEAEFKDFTKKFLGPVYLQNIEINFGKNISDVYPKKIPFLSQDSTFFIGKFKDEKLTKMQLKASGEDYELNTEDLLDLQNFQEHPSSQMLPNLWQDVSESYSNIEKTSSKKNNFWLESFPYLLLLLGIIFLYFAVKRSSSPQKYSRKNNGFQFPDHFDTDFWNMPLEETPLFKEWEKSLPI